MALEEKRSEIRKKLQSVRETPEALRFHFGSAPPKATQELRELIKKNKPGLLIVDVLQKFCRIKDLNDYAQVTNALAPLMTIAREENCHILLTHHSGKVDRQDGDDILGSTAFLGGVDTLIQMKKRDKRRTFFTIQRYGADVSETVVELTPDGVLEGAGTRQEAELEETIPLIVNACEGAPRTEREIWDESEKKHDIASKAIRVAVDRGILSRKGGGKKNDPYLYEILSCAPQGVIPTSGRESETNAKPLKVRQEFSPQCFNLGDETSGRESAGWEDLR